MKTTCHEITVEGRLECVPLDQALSRWKAGAGAFWINAADYDTASLQALVDEIGVTGFLRQRCLRAGKTTIVVAVPKGTFLDALVFADRTCRERARVSALCLRDLLLTMSADPTESADQMQRSVEHMELDALSTSTVLCSLLLRQATISGDAARDLRERAGDITERMGADIGSVDPEALDDLVHAVHLTMAMADEQEEAFSLLADAESDGFEASKLRATLGLLRTTGRSTERLIQRLDHRVENLLRQQQDYKQELLNRRLGLLTIISAVFMPLTLLAGIWGMNFEHMPELDEPYAYAGALTLMALVAVGSAWLFYKRGWFD